MAQNGAQEPDILAIFQGILAQGPPGTAELPALLRALESAEAAEAALQALKRAHPRATAPKDPWHALRVRLDQAATRARERRMSRWQHDPRRRTLRLRFAQRGPAAALSPAALQAALGQALQAAGLPVALGLEKSPRPVLRLGAPLPLGVEGLGEWADVVLSEPVRDLAGLPARVSPRCPEGLELLACEEIPNHASPVPELCREAHWRWRCPEALRPAAEARVAAFLAADTWELEKTGKVGGQKQVKRVEVRPLVRTADWEGAELCLATRIALGEALNPRKLLAGLLGCEPEAIQGLSRERVLLAEDPRLEREDRYQPKLSNIFEDAVLLETGAPVTLVDEDDDETTLLGD